MLSTVEIELLVVAIGIFFFTYLQNIAQTYASERVARDLRTRLVAKLSVQDLAYIQQTTTAKLLTNLTSDVDAVKMFVSQAVGSLVSSVFLILGASVLLLAINWKLGLAVLAVLPVIGVTFTVVLGRVRKLFTKSQQAIDWLNKVINESILGAALIRLLNSQQLRVRQVPGRQHGSARHQPEHPAALRQPHSVIMFSTNLATLMILTLGGHFVIAGVDEPWRLHRVQQLSRDPHLPGHPHRLHEQCDGAGQRLVRAHLEACLPLRTQARAADDCRSSRRHHRSPTSS